MAFGLSLDEPHPAACGLVMRAGVELDGGSGRVVKTSALNITING